MELLRLNIADGERKASPGELAFQVAVLAAIASTAASFFARFAFGAPLIPELAAQFIFAVAPIWLVEIAVGMLGPFAKHLGFLACTVLYLLMLGGATLAFLSKFAKRYTEPPRAEYVLLFCCLFLVASGLIIVPALGGGLFGRRLPQGVLQTFGWLSLGVAALGFVIYYAGGYYLGVAKVESPSRLLTRRRLVRAAGYGVVLVGIYDIGRQLLGSWLTSGSGRVRGGDGSFPNIENLALEVTPTADFYQVSKNAYDPIVEPGGWRLEVGGMVESPLSLSLDDIRSLPAVEQYATLCCISNEVGGDLIGNARWQGVRLKDVLVRAGLKPGVIDIVLRAADDYSDSIPLDRALDEGTLLAYAMNDRPLLVEHGFPLRLLVPGIYGMKNVKWIKRIEAVDFDFKGYWQRRGWDDRAEYKTMSRIDTPESPVRGETTVAGIAFAGDRAVSKVEVSVDGGRTWQPAEIKESLGPNTWVLWHKQWTPDASGKHRLLVRATDGSGVTQTSTHAPPAPDGSSGYHSVIVERE